MNYDDLTSTAYAEHDPALLDKIQRLKAGLKINEHELTDALAQQPILFLEARETAVHLASHRDQCKRLREEAESVANHDARTRLEAEGGRVTEAKIASAAAIDANVSSARSTEMSAHLAHGIIQAVAEAYHQRAYMLREITSIHGQYQGAPDTTRDALAAHRAENPPATRQRLSK